MSREQLEADLSAYVDGELDEARAQELSRALEQDPALRDLEQRLRGAAERLRALPAPAPSRALRAAVLDAVATPTLGERLRGWLTPPRLGLALAASLAGVAVWWGTRPVPGFGADVETLAMAQHLELLEDYDLVGLDAPGDLEVVAALDELEGTP